MNARSSLVVAVATARNARQRNEDAVGVDGWMLSGEPGHALRMRLPVPAPDGAAVIAVADGLGGAPAGDIAARLGVQILTGAAAPRDEAGIQQRFGEADGAIHDAARTSSAAGMACCAALISVLADQTALIGHVGDVRIYRRSDQYLGQLTEDHRALLEGNAVTRCLGGSGLHTTAEPDVLELRLTHGDRFILCTDGVHGTLDPDQLRRCAAVADPQAAVEQLIAAASKGSDNATAVVLDVVIEDEPAPAARPAPTATEPRRRGRKSRWRG